MVTLLRNKYSITAIIVLLGGCQTTAPACTFIATRIHIENWHDPLPKSISLQVVSLEGASRKVTEDIPYSAYISDPVPAYGWGPALSLTPTSSAVNRLMINYEYIVMIDEKPVYRISGIESSRPALGCPVTSFKVNSCQGKLSPNLKFDASCR